jgi:maltooligosyltrehalose trehalohydrolase
MQSFRPSRVTAGAGILPEGGARFRIWAPRRRSATVVMRNPARSVRLSADGDGWFSADVRDAGAGTLYQFQLDDESTLYPDPMSRFQPEGPHGPSEVVDPEFPWSDAAWQGVPPHGQVLYELHIGTFTPEGTYEAASRELEALADLGITCLELMPLADFPGRFGWGYDGVNLFAPKHEYGRPDDLRRLVDRAHGAGLGVILDVVYNHLGPDGNYLDAFSAEYFTDRYPNDWGRAINFDGEHSAPVREFFVANAVSWISEYHVDGLRLDATQSIIDRSRTHIIADIARAAREAAGRRSILLVGENEPQESRLARQPAAGGLGLDALWNDDLHHSAVVAVTGRAEAYYSDHHGRPQEFISAAKWGYLFQGQRYAWQGQRRGTPALDLVPAAFVTFVENHDQIANSPRGTRLSQRTTPGRYRAVSALLLLLPSTPMLFQGQEFASSKPFLYFADHRPDLALQVRRGRVEFLRQFESIDEPAMRERLRDPADPDTFTSCKLDFAERERHGGTYALYRDLLELRRTDDAFRGQGRVRRLDGAVLGPEAFLLRFFAGTAGQGPEGEPHGGDRLLLVNFGPDLRLDSAPEPLLAPPTCRGWEVRWSSEDPAYDGGGTPVIEDETGGWRLPGHAAVVMRPRSPSRVPPGEER